VICVARVALCNARHGDEPAVVATSWCAGVRAAAGRVAQAHADGSASCGIVSLLSASRKEGLRSQAIRGRGGVVYVVVAGIGDRQLVASSDSCVVSCPIADFGSDVHEEGANRVPD
jgi:hypothetical protein